MLPNPWLILGLLIAWALSLAAVGYWQNNAGHVAERSVWQERETSELITANTLIVKLNDDARKKEADQAALQAEISAHYQKALKNVKDQAAADRLAIRAGTLILRDPGIPGLGADHCRLPETTPGAGGRDGRAGTDLSPASAEFLLSEAERADYNTYQLRACQAVVRADRE